MNGGNSSRRSRATPDGMGGQRSPVFFDGQQITPPDMSDKNNRDLWVAWPQVRNFLDDIKGGNNEYFSSSEDVKSHPNAPAFAPMIGSEGAKEWHAWMKHLIGGGDPATYGSDSGTGTGSGLAFTPVYPPGLTNQLSLGFNPDFVNSLVNPMQWQPTFGLHGKPKAPSNDRDKKR